MGMESIRTKDAMLIVTSKFGLMNNTNTAERIICCHTNNTRTLSTVTVTFIDKNKF